MVTCTKIPISSPECTPLFSCGNISTWILVASDSRSQCPVYWEGGVSNPRGSEQRVLQKLKEALHQVNNDAAKVYLVWKGSVSKFHRFT